MADLLQRQISNSIEPEQAHKINFAETHLGTHLHRSQDKKEYRTEDGFNIKVSQNTVGGTFLSVGSSEKDVKVSILQNRGENDESWVEISNVKPYTFIDADWPDLGGFSGGGRLLSEIKDQLGREGVRWGVVKVEDANSGSKYFAIGARFEGKVDDWRVKTAYFRIDQKDAPQESQSTKQIGS